MITRLESIYPNVLVFEARDRVSREDYTQVLEPALAGMKDRTGSLDLVYIINTDLSKYSLGAMWKDGLVGLVNVRSFGRIAVVADKVWLQKAIALFGKLIPGESRGFPLGASEEAITWAAADSG